MEIKVGDPIITIDGQRGIIDLVCNCEECKKRGFDEPRIKFADGSSGYITNYDESHGFVEYYQIGENVWPEHVSKIDLERYIDEQRLIADGVISRIYDAVKLLDTMAMK
jgi:hypothetical protein